MELDDIRRHYAKRPFRPFMIYTSDEREVLVDHPEIMILSEEDAVLVVYRHRDGAHIIDLDSITQLHVIPPPSKPKRRAA